MAQKREKEETELKVPDTLTLRSPPISERSDPKIGVVAGVLVDFRPNAAVTSPDGPDLLKKRKSEARDVSDEVDEDTVSACKRRVVNRCSGCNKKVGLTGFKCRCGDMFCSKHRYSDRHDCSYDYKAAGREAIARENPVVRALKLLKV